MNNMNISFLFNLKKYFPNKNTQYKCKKMQSKMWTSSINKNTMKMSKYKGNNNVLWLSKIYDSCSMFPWSMNQPTASYKTSMSSMMKPYKNMKEIKYALYIKKSKEMMKWMLALTTIYNFKNMTQLMSKKNKNKMMHTKKNFKLKNMSNNKKMKYNINKLWGKLHTNFLNNKNSMYNKKISQNIKKASTMSNFSNLKIKLENFHKNKNMKMHQNKMDTSFLRNKPNKLYIKNKMGYTKGNNNMENTKLEMMWTYNMLKINNNILSMLTLPYEIKQINDMNIYNKMYGL